MLGDDAFQVTRFMPPVLKRIVEDRELRVLPRPRTDRRELPRQMVECRTEVVDGVPDSQAKPDRWMGFGPDCEPQDIVPSGAETLLRVKGPK